MPAMRTSWIFIIGAVTWAAAPLATAADSFTVGVLSCAAETDRDRRLDCYDRAVAAFTAALSSGRRESAAPSPPAAVNQPAPTSDRAVKAVPATSAAPNQDTAQPPAGNAGKAAPAARHVTAHINSIDHFPDYVVLHLDNQQTWKQVSDSSGAALLRMGDAVTIDKEMGSYWLAGPKGESVQVRLEAPKP
jgi:hypothetical protein